MERAILALSMMLAACHVPASERTSISSLELRGVRRADARALRDGLASTPAKPWQRRRVFDELALDADRERVLRYFRARGYFGATVTTDTRPHRGGRSVDVVITVDPGLPALIDDMRVLIRGPIDPTTRHAVEDEQLALRRGQVFVHDRYAHLKDVLLAALKDRGYPWVRVDGDVQVDRSKNVATVDLALEPGSYQRVGRLELEPESAAPTATRDGHFRLGRTSPMPLGPHYIEEVFGVPVGAPFNQTLLERGRARVLALGIFSTVALSYAEDPEHAGVTTLRLRLAGASLHELRIGGAIDVESKRNELAVQLLYTKRSFLGGLRTFELRLRPSYVVLPAVWSTIARHGPAAVAEATFTQPRLGRLSELQASVGYDLAVAYAYQRHGPRARLAIAQRLLRGHVSLGLGYGFQLVDFFATAPELTADPALERKAFGYAELTRLGELSEVARVDWRDDARDPRKGYFAEVKADEGGTYLGGSFTYEEISAKTSGYLPLGSRVVLDGRVEYSRFWSQGDATPLTRRLSLGGEDSHRGFTEGRLAPQIGGSNGPLPIGGDEAFFVSAEARVDLVTVAQRPITLVGFVDAGDVGAARGDTVSGWRPGVDWLHLHCAVGGGLRYHSPIGLVRAGVGVRLNRVSASEPDGRRNPDPGGRVAFHVSLVEAF